MMPDLTRQASVSANSAVIKGPPAGAYVGRHKRPGDLAAAVERKHKHPTSQPAWDLDAIRRETQSHARRLGARSLEELDLLATTGQMVYGLAHDIRHYLSCIVANVEQMTDARMGCSPDIDCTQEIYEVVAEMCDMLDLSILRAGDLEEIPKSPLALDLVVEDAIRRVRCHPRGKGVEISFQKLPMTPQSVNRTMLGSAIFNLVLNSCQAAEKSVEPGCVEVSLTHIENSIIIRVADNGPGVPEAVKKAMLKSFWTKRETGGFGLGIGIVDKTARAHGGSFFLEESQSGKTVFALSIPCATVPTT